MSGTPDTAQPVFEVPREELGVGQPGQDARRAGRALECSVAIAGSKRGSRGLHEQTRTFVRRLRRMRRELVQSVGQAPRGFLAGCSTYRR